MSGRVPVLHFAAICVIVLLSGCRTKAPVVRHFLRMPAECTGGLSSIQRARWLKENKGSLPGRRTLAATGHLKLAGTVTTHGTAVRSLEMVHTKGTGGAEGLAVVTVSGEQATARPRLRLLEYRQGSYAEVTSKVPATGDSGMARWSVNSSRSLTGHSPRDLPRVEVFWNDTQWSSRAAGGDTNIIENATSPARDNAE